jgi:hypothetical protein
MTRIGTHLRIAAVLLIATIAVGAGARLGAKQGAATAGPSAALAREFRAATGGPVHFSGALEGTAVLPNSDRHVRMELAIGAGAEPSGVAARMPTDLVVVLDRSGSMAGDKIEQARAAVRARSTDSARATPRLSYSTARGCDPARRSRIGITARDRRFDRDRAAQPVERSRLALGDRRRSPRRARRRADLRWPRHQATRREGLVARASAVAR